MAPFITICIPAYKRPGYLNRLLESIRKQHFKDYEIIITDDSPDDSVSQILTNFTDLPIFYQLNQPALGTPANWNRGITSARGTWIKLMHDDDWFVNEYSLAKFAETAASSKAKFIFSSYLNNFEVPGKSPELKQLPGLWKNRILREPMTLLAYNVIGPPSVVLVHSSVKETYNEVLKWRVDMEFYVRLLSRYKFYEYIDTPLINVGVSESQVTQSCIYNPDVELPEGLFLLKTHGSSSLNNIIVYDAWWRLLRNLSIRDSKTLELHSSEKWPLVIHCMIKHLSKCPEKFLKIGILSKIGMCISFLINPYKKVT